MNACTIIARNYLAFARVLARSIAEQHPGARFTTLVLDVEPSDTSLDDEPFSVLSPYEIGLDRAELHRMAMIYDVMELATAVKPWLLRTLLDAGAQHVVYLDPDTRVYAPLEVADLAEQHGIVLVPHVTEPMPRDGLVPSETTILHAGIFNLGFIAVGNGGREFLEWWSDRLRRECVLDPEQARFVDQRWVDFVPALFDHVVVRDPGYDVAHWNLWSREVVWTGARYEVNGEPLRFYHFSGFDPERPRRLSKHQGAVERVRISENPALVRLYDQYAEEVRSAGYAATRMLPYRFDRLNDGTPIDKSARRSYRARLLKAETTGHPLPEEPFVGEFLTPSASRGWRDLPKGVNVAGYLTAELGIGEAARQLLSGIADADIPHLTLTFTRGTLSRRGHPLPEAEATEPRYDTNIVCVNADQFPVFAEEVGASFFEQRYSIGVWWWEVPAFPPQMQRSLDFVDEVWVGSDYTAAAIANGADVPVLKVPIPIVVPEVPPLTRQELGLPDGFLFLFLFDFFSVLERKNPLGLIQAFSEAFAPGHGAKLVLKGINGDKVPAKLAELEAAAANHPDILVVDRYVSPEEKNAMIACCDCYVSLHRSEGLGLTMAEAMAYGKPVIATAHSGNLEFMREDNSLLVPFELVEVPDGCEPYPAGALWADPDVARAAQLMRQVFEAPDSALDIARKGQHTIVTEHTPRRTAQFISERLDEIRSTRAPRPKRQLHADSGDGGLWEAAALLAKPAAISLDTGRRHPVELLRRILRYLLWPHLREQHSVNIAFLEALADLDRRSQKHE